MPWLTTLSFWNLIEVHVLRALRTEHGLSIQAVREALTFAEEKLKTERLLLRRQLEPEVAGSRHKLSGDDFGNRSAAIAGVVAISKEKPEIRTVTNLLGSGSISGIWPVSAIPRH